MPKLQLLHANDRTTEFDTFNPIKSFEDAVARPFAHKHDCDGTETVPSKHDSAVSTSRSIDHHVLADGNERQSPNSKREKIRNIGHEAKRRTKLFIRKQRVAPEEAAQAEDLDDENPYQIIQDNPAFDPSVLGSDPAISAKRIADKTVGNIYRSVRAALGPRDAVKRKAASKVAVQDRPYLSEKADQEYLQAHDRLAQAISDRDTEADTDDGNSVGHEEERIQILKELRESRKVAWTTSRHIKRVLVVPRLAVCLPDEEAYTNVDSVTGEKKLDHWAYFHACNRHHAKAFAMNSMGNIDFAGEQPFDMETCKRYAERILIASSSWQTWFSTLRSLYRWEDPARTTMWFAVWLLIWYFNCIISSVMSYCVYIVLENRYSSGQVERLRESYERALGNGQAAYKFNELISQHGSGSWLDPIIEDVGPKLQLLTGDVADFLEVLNNFYDWTVPKYTWATLFWFVCAILTGVLTSTQFSVKLIWMFCILEFFLSKPIASLHPEYRHVVNALQWIFWDIPTDAEWSMMYLRQKAQDTRERLIAQRVQQQHDNDNDHPTADHYEGNLSMPDASGISLTDHEHDETSSSEDHDDSASDSSDPASFVTAGSATSILGGLDIISFRCYHNGRPGRLVVFSDGLKFVRRSPIHSLQTEKWRRRWSELLEMQKVNWSSIAKVVAVEGLLLKFTDGKEIRLEGLPRRDRAFNCVVGFSGLRFQVLQPVAPADSQKMTEPGEVVQGEGVTDKLPFR